MTDTKKNILVTGGAGYIGSQTCKILKKAGYNPIVYDNLVSGYQHLVKWGPFELGDVCDEDRLVEVINKYNPVAIIHFAAYIAAGESVENPGKYYQNNVIGSLTLLQAMQKCGVKNIIFSSTAAVYGNPISNEAIDEGHPKNPLNAYGASKLMVERMLDDYRIAYDFKYIALRYFNVAGADPEGETGCEQKQVTNLIPVIMRVQGGEQENLKVFGTDYDTSDGTGIRDYIHVVDLANAHVLALDYLLKTGESNILNLGTGHGHSVKEVVNAASEVTGKDVPCVYVARRAGDPSKLVADPSKAGKVLGWKAKYTDIADMVSSAWKWYSRER